MLSRVTGTYPAPARACMCGCRYIGTAGNQNVALAWVGIFMFLAPRGAREDFAVTGSRRPGPARPGDSVPGPRCAQPGAQRRFGPLRGQGPAQAVGQHRRRRPAGTSQPVLACSIMSGDAPRCRRPPTACRKPGIPGSRWAGSLPARAAHRRRPWHTKGPVARPGSHRPPEARERAGAAHAAGTRRTGPGRWAGCAGAASNSSAADEITQALRRL